MNRDIDEKKLNERAKQLQMAYLKSWKDKNKEKVRAYQREYQKRYRLRKAEKELQEEELLKTDKTNLSER